MLIKNVFVYFFYSSLVGRWENSFNDFRINLTPYASTIRSPVLWAKRCILSFSLTVDLLLLKQPNQKKKNTRSQYGEEEKNEELFKVFVEVQNFIRSVFFLSSKIVLWYSVLFFVLSIRLD